MAKSCDFVVVEHPPEGSDESDAMFWRRFFTFGEIEVTSLEDMVDKLLAEAAERGCCIRSLVIHGHGSPGVIAVGEGQKWETGKHIDGDSSEWGPQLERLKPKLCPGAVVTLYGCNVGAEKAGADKLYAVARWLGATVRAYTGTTKVTGNGKGEWIEATPETRPPVRPVPEPPRKRPRQVSSAIPYLRPDGEPAGFLSSQIRTATVRLEPRALHGARPLSIELPPARVADLRAALALYQPQPGRGAEFGIEATVEIGLESGETVPPSYLCGGLGFLVPGGDWTWIHAVGGPVRELLRRAARRAGASRARRRRR